MTTFTSKADIALDITSFIARLWEEIEKQEGAQVAAYYAEDGVFDSKMVCFTGHKELNDWFSWRKDQVRTARHLVTNLNFDFAKWDSDRIVEVRSVMLHFGEFGKGVLPIGDPIGIYDQFMRVSQGGVHGWTIHLLECTPVFVSPDHVALKYKTANPEAVGV